MKHEQQAVEQNLNIAIIGLGLIGGSMARALRSRWERVAKLYAFDYDSQMLSAALREGVIDEGFQVTHPADGFSSAGATALACCDLVILCTPVDLIAPYAHEVAKVSEALLTDAGSIKTSVMQDCAGLHFIGGHPMAGSERHSFICSNEGLFENAVYVLCSSENPHLQSAEDLALLEEMIVAIGACPRRMTAAEHDQAVAVISHLPHVVTACLVNAAAAQGRDSLELAAGGFRDVTRIASSDGGLWTSIVDMSKECLLPVLDTFSEQLNEFRNFLAQGDLAQVQDFFTTAAQVRNNLPAAGGGALMADALINVEVEDRPGELAVIATLLGVRGISIKNMSIVHARQYEGGRLQLFLSEHHQVELAKEILTKAGYECS